MAERRLDRCEEKSACGVGFVASRGPEPSRRPLLYALSALDCLEHRGACLADGVTGDGAGVMTDIPFDLLGQKRGRIALCSLMLLGTDEQRARALASVEDTFGVMGIDPIARRQVPTEPRVLGAEARRTLPELLHVVFAWPRFCRTDASFAHLLYIAKQKARTRLKREDLYGAVSFVSLSANTVVYKALCRAEALGSFYPDLRNSRFRTRFALFHRRFSTNTRTSWDKAQPFRLIAHNGEINTIAGNRSWSYSREQALGLPRDELLTHEQVSDSGNLNEMVEALKYRSSIPYIEDVLAIMIPPAQPQHGGPGDNHYYRFWSRAAEPWDGPALVTYCDGQAIGARIDRNGFRPCRWAMTDDMFFLSSEAGVFGLDEATVRKKGTLKAGSGVKMVLGKPEVFFRDPSRSEVNREGILDPRLTRLVAGAPRDPTMLEKKRLFGLGSEELDKVLAPMMQTGKEPIGSMGDTAALAVLTREHRSFFDFFFQTFAQVTNPPLDYLRERLVTDLSVYLGRSPNIFLPKELLPPRAGILVDSPVLRLGQLAALLDLAKARAGETLGPDLDEGEVPSLVPGVIDICFDRSGGPGELRRALERIGKEALRAVREGASVLILSDLEATAERPPCPSLLALRAAVRRLNQWGLRLRTSVVVATGDARTPHHVACLVGFGASAVCPVLAFELARYGERPSFGKASPEEREENMAKALEGGLLKIMSKMGISVVRSYTSAKLFTAVGLGDEVVDDYFRGLTSPIGGLGLDDVGERILAATTDMVDDEPVVTYQLKEHNKGVLGEAHSMTARRARLLHDVLEAQEPEATEAAYRAYALEGADAPVTIRHLLALKTMATPAPLDEVEPREAIMRRFGSGSMSFGAISAESQRDIIRAMKTVGGRSGSGEGGENPWYFKDGTTATVKQVASARFGVNAEYLMVGEEFEIKIAQGAKPGEGGQLMGVKVTDAIARARFAKAGVDLISPPPLHDIYSIEDLKELIYELKQVKPEARVCVKLVSGAHIGTVAVGVAKAGADAIQVSGGDGGTGAASISSMKHAGLPWELGLVAVHRALAENDLRAHVEVRVDGGLSVGEDVVMAALLGADGFGFGKLLLIAEGCIMARVCEKNTCPRGIATHDPRFLAKYRGSEGDVVRTLELLADDVRRHLAALGARTLDEIRGRTDLLEEKALHRELLRKKGIDLSGLLTPAPPVVGEGSPLFSEGVSPLNQQILDDARPVLEGHGLEGRMLEGRSPRLEKTYPVRSVDRAVTARLSGEIARGIAARRAVAREAGRPADDVHAFDLDEGALRLTFRGSAGQGFGVFLVAGLDVELIGEANDSVAKGMSGGRVVVRPPEEAQREPEENVILGNCALYGATGGVLLAAGCAGDRFAVRNSGARAVVEGAGLHCGEYMTGGLVVVLGPVSANVGAGMTGGRIVVPRRSLGQINAEYAREMAFDAELVSEVRALLVLQRDLAKSPLARRLLEGDLFLRELAALQPASEVSGAGAGAGAAESVSGSRTSRPAHHLPA